VTPLRDRDFPHRVAVASLDERWNAPEVAATAEVTGDAPYRGYLRIDDRDGTRFAYVAGRFVSAIDGMPVCDGLLYAVDGSLRRDPRGFPTNGRSFRQLSEVTLANAPALWDRLRAAYSPPR